MLVSLDQVPDERPVQGLPDPGVGAGEPLAGHLVEVAAEPRVQRDAGHGLAAVDQGVGKQRPGRLAKDPLRRGSTHLDRGRSLERHLSQAVVQQGHGQLERRTTHAAGADPLDRKLRDDLRHWLPDTLLERADRMSMAASLELAVPLLDDRLAEVAFRLPSSVKVRAATTKWVLRQAARPLLPHALIDRREPVSRVPLDSWFRRDLHEVARERLTGADSWVGQTLDRSFVRDLVERHDHGAGQEVRLWTLLCLEMWHECFFDAPPSVPRARPVGITISPTAAAPVTGT